MSVYFIRAGEDGPVKIGVAKDAAKRLAALQTASHVPLKIIRLVRGGRDVEAALHVQFAHLRQHGEWFGFSEAMLAAGHAVEIPTPKVRCDLDPLILECAKSEGISRNALKQWRRRGVPHHFRCHVMSIARERGVPVPAFEKAAA